MVTPTVFEELEATIVGACAQDREWPAQIAAGIYAGINFAIAHPDLVESLSADRAPGGDSLRRYDLVITRMAQLLRERAPADRRLSGSTDEALVGGVVGLVGDHLRIGKVERLTELCPDLVLLTLLPYLGFDEARRWANQLDTPPDGS